MGQKQVIVNVGPHKTGSTAIQKWLHSNPEFLRAHELAFLQTNETHEAAKLIANERYLEAEQVLAQIAAQILRTAVGTVILSQEDFVGELPGRTRKRGIYTRLVKNLRIIKKSLAPHQVVFVFFERKGPEWLKSCYHQHLRYRTQFHEFSAFQEHLGGIPDWDAVLEKAEAVLKASLRREVYIGAPDSGVRSLLSIANVVVSELPSVPARINQSPSADRIAALERINALSSFPRTAWFSKQLFLDRWSPEASRPIPEVIGQYNGQSAALALPKLFERAKNRFPPQDAEDLLPDERASLDTYLTRRLPTEVECPSVSRSAMRDQSLLLDYHLRGKSELAKLNALSISYLRRDTPHTGKARSIFHRIWREYGAYLINELSSRWLISTLQTFLDHGENEAQRLIGGCGYFYSNMLKIYEGERSIEGLEQDGVLAGTEPVTTSKFRGLDRYRVGGTDLLLNTNALALELSLRDNVAGIVLQEFLLRVKNSGNVFTRADATRVAYNVEIDQFQDTWSFFTKPNAAEQSDGGTST